LIRGGASEGRHGGFAGGADALAANHLLEREQKYTQIKPEAVAIDVPNVKTELFLPGESITAVNLSQTTKAWLDIVATGLLSGIKGQILHQQGPRANKTHLSTQDVEKSREFIDGGTTQPATKWSEPLGVRHEFTIVIAVVCHRTELKQAKGLSSVAGALLAENHGGAMLPEN
jgi:hypothetical protein